MRQIFTGLIVFLFFAPIDAQENPQAQPPVPYGNILVAENGFKDDPKEMMKSFLLADIASEKTAWRQRYEKLKTLDQIESYQTQRRTFLRDRLGKTWDRTPLNPRVTKTFEKGTPGKDAYRTEMILFESVPGFYVSGAVFLPDPTRFEPPYPAVLVVCGHSDTGKAYELYQKVPALAATHGLLAMSIDPIDQGERSQCLNPDGKPFERGVAAHNTIGAGSILLGRNAATFEYWDMVRALDYLQSRPDVLPKKIGVTGTSGGGTQTSYIMALDDRVAAAVPSCYLCGLYDLASEYGPQDAEQNIFGQLSFGMDHVDYCIMRAPKPTLIETTTEDFFPAEGAWSTARDAKRIFDRFGFSDRMSIIEADGKHGWHKTMREASIRWMLRRLADRDEAIFEAEDMPIFPVDEFRATPDGEVLLLDDARSAFDLNRDYNDELLAVRKSKNEARSKEEIVAAVRNTTGIRPLPEIPKLDVENKGMIAPPAAIADVVSSVERFVLKAENGRIVLPALCFTPKNSKGGWSLFLHEKGKAADLDSVAALLRDGKTVLAVDLRGLGETQAVRAEYYQHERFGTDGIDYYLAYLLGKSYVGMRTEDLLAAARWWTGSDSPGKIELVASGETVGLVALHAASMEPDMFSGVVFKKPIRSWYEVVQVGDFPYPMTNLVHGALLEYDVPDLMRLCSTVSPQFDSSASLEKFAETLWNLDDYLASPPKTEWGQQVTPLVRELYYEGEPFEGKPTRVFAYYGRPEGKGPFPAVLLIHGGGGKAFSDWAELWAKKGYVALAMDLAGHGPDGKLPDGGPDQEDTVKFRDFTIEDGDYKSMWTYQAIAAILRGHAVLANREEVDHDRIAATGISWGGYLTCILAGVDSKLRAAVPVYGCGFLHENSCWKSVFDGMEPKHRDRWVALFDPSRHVGKATCPMLFVNGTNDFAYPLDSYEKTYSLPKGDVSLSIAIELPHGHIFTFREVDAFIDGILLGTQPLAKVSEIKVDFDKKQIKADWTGVVPVEKAVLAYTDDSGPWVKRPWKSVPAEVRDGTLIAPLPEPAPTCFFFILTDERGLSASTPIEIRSW